MTKDALVGNAADEEQVAEAQEKELRGRELELEDLRFVLGTPQGRRMIWRYLSRCGVYQTSFSENTNTTYFREGERNIGLVIHAEALEASSDLFLKMMQEAESEKNKSQKGRK